MVVQAIANLHDCPRAHRSTDSNSWLVYAERSAGEVRGSAMARGWGCAVELLGNSSATKSE